MADQPRIEAVDRALVLLQELSRHGASGAGLAALAQATGSNKATAYRALSTLRLRGFAVQHPDGNYGLGPAAMLLGEGHYGPRALAQDLHPALTRLARATNELVHLGGLVGDEIVYLDKVEPDRAIRVWSAIGRTMPVVATSLGRAWLAELELGQAQLKSYLDGQRGRSRVSLGKLCDALARARELGYATEREENEPGVACMGTAVLQAGRPVAAVSVTVLAESLTAQREQEIARVMREQAAGLLPAGLTLAVER